MSRATKAKAKAKAARAVRSLPAKKLTGKQARAVKGGQKFMLVKMNDVIITGVTHGGSEDK